MLRCHAGFPPIVADEGKQLLTTVYVLLFATAVVVDKFAEEGEEKQDERREESLDRPTRRLSTIARFLALLRYDFPFFPFCRRRRRRETCCHPGTKSLLC